MNSKIKDYLQGAINNEGFDDAILNYAAWGNSSTQYYVDDPKFQILYENLFVARNGLIHYMASQGFENLD